MKKHYLGEGPNGPRFDFDFNEDAEGLASGELAIFSSPGTGLLELADGTTYRSDQYFLVRGEHLAELHTIVHRSHHAAGRFLENPVPDDEYAAFQADHFAAAEDRKKGLVTLTSVGEDGEIVKTKVKAEE